MKPYGSVVYPVTKEMNIDLVEQVWNWGRPVDSRYGPCREILGGRFEMACGSLVTRPGINYSLGWMELVQLVAGVYDLDAIKRVAPKANHSLFTYEMAYGPRLLMKNSMEQILYVLRTNPDSRQAVIFIGNYHDGPSSNLPCTLTIQFLVRQGKLHAVVSMRSWDLCRGLPYDIMMFSGLQAIVAWCLQRPPGQLIVNAGSAHIYEDQIAKIPEWASKRWFLKTNLSSWGGFVEWANVQVQTLQKGETPEGIIIH